MMLFVGFAINIAYICFVFICYISKAFLFLLFYTLPDSFVTSILFSEYEFFLLCLENYVIKNQKTQCQSTHEWVSTQWALNFHWLELEWLIACVSSSNYDFFILKNPTFLSDFIMWLNVLFLLSFDF